jgi:hypothetical protein
MQLPTDLTALATIAVAVLQTLLLAIAGFVAWFQLREAAKSRYLGALVRVFEEFGSREAYADADNVLGLPARFADFTPEEVELATWVVRVYEKIAFLVESGMIPEQYIVPLYSRRIVWTWDAVQPYVEEQRRLRDTGGAYQMSGDALHFEGLAARALAHRQRVFKRAERAHPPIPVAYRRRLETLMAAGQSVAPRSNTTLSGHAVDSYLPM